QGKGWATFFRVVERESGRLERELAVGQHVRSWGVSGETLYLGLDHDATEVQAFDLTTGRKLMSRVFGKDFLHGITASPEGVYVQMDSAVVLVDAKGRVLGRAPIERRGNPPPLVAGERVYVCEGGLRVFDRKLKPIFHVKHPRWVLHCSIEGEIAILRAREDLYVVDLQRMAIIASHALPQNYWAAEHGPFDGQRLPVLEAVLAESAGSRHLAWLTRVPAEPLEVRGLPPGAALLENGEPASSLLTRGRHFFDVYRPGAWPVRAPLDVRGGQPAVLDLARIKLEPAPVRAPVRFDHLPNDLQLLDLKSFGQRDELVLPYGSRGRFPDRNRRITLDGERGLFARALRTGLNDWVVEPKALETDAPPLNVKSPFTSAELFALLPEARLALLHTRGHAPGTLIAYELDGGKRRWKVSTNLLGAPGSGEYYMPHALSWGGLVWYQTDEWLHGHDERDGHVVYRHRVSDQEGLWGPPVIHAGRLFAIHRKELIALDLLSRQIVWRNPISGRGYLRLGPQDASLLFVDEKQARLISFDGKDLAKSPLLGGDLDGNPTLIEPDGVYLCGHTKKTTHLLDSVTLRPRWSFTNRDNESSCPSLFSATQVALLDGKRTIVLDRATGKVLLNELGFLPNSDHIVADKGGVCLLERKGSFCLDR
ncbi:MAG TPA: PQQ-binding-like beta-propeller repeat protein, partial [Polyangiaceae bacterium]|nr:PQQ-binding-like beta-propeller repeat protein [Polyangiaceae bacterium]